MTSDSHRSTRDRGLIGALRRVRDPLLLLALPVVFALLLSFAGYGASWPIGFDFRGTLWEPANALLDGRSFHPEPARDAIVVGNPSVYPPLFIILSIPLALLPVGLAAWIWFGVLAVAVVVAMWIVGVRDWRCHVLAVTCPLVVQGLYFGNLTVLLLVPLALAWRYRDEARVVGIALGAAVAAKLFLAPLVAWLLLTRRFRAAAWMVGASAALVLGSWALVGFEGLREYLDLLRTLQDTYAVRSLSLSTAMGALGLSVDAAVAVAAVAGLACLAAAAVLRTYDDGDRVVFALAVGACVVGSSIVWLNYAALLLVPIAIVWARLAPVWFFGYPIWLAVAVSPKSEAQDNCCRPADVPVQAWLASHSEPAFWPPAAVMTGAALVLVLIVVRRRSQPGTDGGMSRIASQLDHRPGTLRSADGGSTPATPPRLV